MEQKLKLENLQLCIKEAGFACVTNELYVGLLSLNMALKS